MNAHLYDFVVPTCFPVKSMTLQLQWVRCLNELHCLWCKICPGALSRHWICWRLSKLQLLSALDGRVSVQRS